MKELRRQLRAARAAHEATRYTGDLAQDVLGSSRTHAWHRLAIAAGVAIVALISAAWLMRSESTQVEQIAEAPAPAPATQQVDIASSGSSDPQVVDPAAEEALAFTVVPSGWSSIASVESVSFVGPAMPTMPSFEQFASEVETEAESEESDSSQPTSSTEAL